MTPAPADAPIGVFDSGIGGLSVLRALAAELPAEAFVYFSDAGHAPYGEKGDAFVTGRCAEVARRLRDEHGVKAMVVACNTATAAAIQLLRDEHRDIPLVGIEPALKPAAALTRTGRVAVFATRGTLASEKFRRLHESLKPQADYVLQACDGLAAAIESSDESQVRMLCERYVRAAGRFGTGHGEVDTLVLGCTHYPFASAEFARLVGGDVRQLETGVPVARQVRRMLQACGGLRGAGSCGIVLRTTGSQAALEAAAARWLPQPAASA